VGSGRKSNGYRPVRGVDGPKKRGKKQMSKTRRADEKKEANDFNNCVDPEFAKVHTSWLNMVIEGLSNNPLLKKVSNAKTT
jgi:hypothetical protein